MRQLLPAFVLLCAAALPVRAFSQQAQGSGGGFSGSGSFTATENQDGSYTIDTLTGDANSGVGSLIAPGGFNGNDNLLFPADTSVVDGYGFSFTDVQGDTGFQVNIFSTDANGDYTAYIYDSDGLESYIPVTFSLTPEIAPAFSGLLSPQTPGNTTNFNFSIATVASTPEPSSLVLLGTGLLVVGGFAHRRRVRSF